MAGLNFLKGAKSGGADDMEAEAKTDMKAEGKQAGKKGAPPAFLSKKGGKSAMRGGGRKMGRK